MEQATRNRLVVITAAVLLLALAIGGRLYQLQVQDSERLRARAQNQHERRVVVPARRGSILDREGRELAVSVETRSLYAHPSRVADPQTLAARLAPVLGRSRAELLGRLRSDRPFVFLERFLDAETVAAIEALDLEPDDPHAIGFLTESKRRYPLNELGVHVIGIANIDGVGVEGIEKQYDESLRGKPTVYRVQQDARRRGLAERPIETPGRRPSDVVLTLDVVLQHIAERELDRAMRETGARAASAVLLDPATGQVLALANRPAADANRFGRARAAERINRAVVHYYEPGSTFKLVPMAAALEQGSVRLDQRFNCEQGTMTVSQRTIRDVSPHGLLTPREILAQSSNIGMVKITRTLAPSVLRETIERFGFGADTGIELPGESAGRFLHESRWSSYTLDSLAFGQEIGVTVLQMAASMAAIANDGVWVAPRVVLGTRTASGEFHPAPPAPSRRAISRRTAVELRAMMEGVIAEGSGARAAVAGYRLGGKSGTAQKAVRGGYSDSEYMASFGGFGPSYRPRLVGLVVLDSPRGEWIYGGQVAAPVFARIMEDALRHLRVPYDRDPATAQTEQRVGAAAVATPAVEWIRPPLEPTAPGTVPDVRGLGMRQALTRLADRGCGALVSGQGVVLEQRPAAGEPLPDNHVCRMVLGPPERLATETATASPASEMAR